MKALLKELKELEQNLVDGRYDCESNEGYYKAITDVIEKIEKLTVIHSSTTLNEKYTPTFDDYLLNEGYTLNNRFIWQKNNKEIDMIELCKLRKEYLNL